MVLADEPTGSLDEMAGDAVVKLIRELCQENGASLLLVSHDRNVVETFEKRIDFQELNKTSVVAEEANR